MKIDWIQLLNDLSVDYIESGPKTTKGHVNVKCPYCDNDPGHHLGLSFATGRHYCWRDVRHRGSDPAAVLAKVAGVSYDRARELIGQTGITPHESIGDLKRRHASILNKNQYEEAWPGIDWPGNFFIPDADFGQGFNHYLNKRGFRGDPGEFARYNLRACMTGRFRYRVMFPAYGGPGGRMIGYTGRAIGSDGLRYLSYPSGRALASAVFTSPQALTDRGRVLVVVEGPTDALRIIQAGERFGVNAVSLFSLTLRPAQLEILTDMADRHDRVVVLLDAAAQSAAERVRQHLSVFGAKPMRLPHGIKDPGSLTSGQAVQLCESWVADRQA